MKLTDRKINLLNSLLIIISLFLVYSNSFNNSFNWDDTYLIQNNPRIEKIENYIFTDSWFRIFNNRSLSLLSFAINYQLNGLDEFGYHLFNLIIHILSSVSLYFLALQLIYKSNINTRIDKKHYSLFALIVALTFAMHPILTDAVTYITQRMASMAGFFVILSTYIYSIFRTSSSKTKKVWGLTPRNDRENLKIQVKIDTLTPQKMGFCSWGLQRLQATRGTITAGFLSKNGSKSKKTLPKNSPGSQRYAGYE